MTHSGSHNASDGREGLSLPGPRTDASSPPDNQEVGSGWVEHVARIIDPEAWDEVSAEDNEDGAAIFAEAWEIAVSKARQIALLSAAPPPPKSGEGDDLAAAEKLVNAKRAGAKEASEYRLKELSSCVRQSGASWGVADWDDLRDFIMFAGQAFAKQQKAAPPPPESGEDGSACTDLSCPQTDTQTQSPAGWRSIDSAPQNQRVLIWRPSPFSDDRVFSAELEDERWVVHDGKHDHALRGAYPTLWMPHPTAPEDAALSGRQGSGANTFDDGQLRDEPSPPPPAEADLKADGWFLVDRLDEFERLLADETDAREFYGHVAPAIARFRAALQT